jgi:hypothetical protein
LARLQAEIEASPALKAELEAYEKARKALFDDTTSTAGARNMKTRSAPVDQGRDEEILTAAPAARFGIAATGAGAAAAHTRQREGDEEGRQRLLGSGY